MPGANKQWDEEEESSSSAPSSPPVGAIRRKFDDEEANDSDVLDSWDAAEDSEVEREKAKKAADAKAKAEAEAAANKKSKSQRIAERQAERRARAEADGYSSEEETEAERRERMRRNEQDADLRHAEDLFGAVDLRNNRKAPIGSAVVMDVQDPNRTIDLSALPVFNPMTKTQFEQMRTTLSPVIAANSKKAHYALFLQEFAKQLAKDLPSDQIKKIASSLTTLSNEKMKEEKAAEKGGKKSKAAKNKTTLAGVSRGPAADVNSYDDAFGDDDFM